MPADLKRLRLLRAPETPPLHVTLGGFSLMSARGDFRTKHN